MAQITAAMVKELREMTGAGMMECKKALTEADGDIDGAVDVLRKRGEAAVVKKAGRATNEGVVMAWTCDTCGAGSLVEVNCETDFVSGNEKYKTFASKLAEAATLADPADMDAFLASRCGDEGTVQDALTEAVHLFGENMKITRFVRLAPAQTGAVVDYIHMGGKLSVLAEFSFGKEATAADDAFKTAARDVCMQIAAADPISVTRDEVDPAVVAHEKEIYKAQSADSGKPEAIQEKMAVGRLNKFYKENCLLEQEFVKDPEKSIKEYLAGVSKQIGDDIQVVRFVRWALGDAVE